MPWDGQSAINFDLVRMHKLPLLHKAASNFLRSADATARARYDDFCQRNSWWLEDYVLFSVLRERFQQQPWNTWPQDIARRKPEIIARLRSELRTELDQERFLQFAFFEQWSALRAYCAATRHSHHR